MKWMPVRFASAIALLWLVSPLLPAAASVGQINGQHRLCDRIELLYKTGQLNIQGEVVTADSLIPELYNRNGYSPIWQREQNMNDLLDMIQSSFEEGLTPADYHQTALIRMLERHRAGAMTPCERADLDILLTDALLRLGYHLLYGKVNPRDLDADWNLKREIYDKDPVDLMQSAIDSDSLKGFLQQFMPVLPVYTRMKQALAEYRAIKARGGWPQIPSGATIKPGEREPRVALIRELLRITGDLADETPAADPMHYDVQLEQAVIRFQKRHALEMDGAVG
ncbi:MAG: peptidoglycan-binding protein, partial [Gammaproteobacteria bacterium]|nr:peptidoglycan-binding protein [Gammaproteobacteria bacterium]